MSKNLWFVGLSLLCAGLASAQTSLPSRARPCVAVHALPAEERLLLVAAAGGEAEAQQSLSKVAVAQGVGASDLTAVLDEAAPLAAQGDWSDSKGQAVASKGFDACARRIYGEGVAERIAACEFDLSTLPVVLLYRVDGQSRASAWSDLQKEGGLSDGSEQARRAPVMLAFAYQGAGPVVGQSRAWIDRKVADWTEQCLAGRLVLPK
ncbi:hypothetical protein [Roseateles koreensis]|uniref:Lysozyme inhibitor LprI N-terminal domain-containing protein n=1 Tax=Roseateles koreensis TaxID=2987526 RepID=A0ABT5KTG2_9BURK|nr:hypothetical protein [Roseateles koreensis]MDC8786228.1 hypothetical protein [Roseateles koreensis]